MKILISGGTGFIGTALMRSLLFDEHSVSILSRNPQKSNLPSGVKVIGWDGQSTKGWLNEFESVDAVVNLAGETVGRWPWNDARKQAILESRVKAGKVMTEAFQLAKRKPAILIQSSGIGYYGPQGDQIVSEISPVGDDFMANVASSWESSSASMDNIPGVRRIIIRTSLVLDSREGVLPLMALPVRMFVGGPLGNGRQGVSWIHIEDEVRAIRFLLQQETSQGAYNLTSPNPVSNAVFIRKLSQALGRPFWMPTPAFALKLTLGEMSTLLLDGQYVMPTRLIESGFKFKYENVYEALHNLYPFQ
ncbi:MAG: TIGR01777 family oxidoreductase [Chloroflexota bacterium]